MPVMSSILTAVLLCTAHTSAPPPAERLAVQVNLEFDPSITSQLIKQGTSDEAAALWRAYGVDLVFADRRADAGLTLDVIVERSDRRPAPRQLTPVLGRTTIAPGAPMQAPIRISFDAIDSLLERSHGVNPMLHVYAIAAALGRVLAHEIGHVLLGAPSYHDADGLMRTTFVSDDLARPDRSRFFLAIRSAARLRTRIASLNDAALLEGCAPPSQ